MPTLVVAALLGLAAPPPKAKAEEVVDLGALHTLIRKAAGSTEPISDADAEKLESTVKLLLERAVKAADLPARKLPVLFKELNRAPAAVKIDETQVAKQFLVAKEVRITSATNSVIVASGNVRFTRLQNCVVIAKNVQATGIEDSIVIAEELVRMTTARRQQGQEGSLLLGGKWVHGTGASGAICYVLHPGTESPPDRPREANSPAVRFNTAADLVILNREDQWKANGPVNCRTIDLKSQIAK
jgi:hypothetical protein